MKVIKNIWVMLVSATFMVTTFGVLVNKYWYIHLLLWLMSGYILKGWLSKNGIDL